MRKMSNVLTTSKGIVTVRPAVPEDSALLYELRLEALDTHPEVFAADYDSTAAESAEAWSQLIAKNALSNSGAVCVAAAQDRLIGMTGLVRGHWPKTRHAGTLWGVYVNADWRGLRVADALIDECIAWARAQGLTMLKLGVVTTNSSAIRCYTRCGFSAYGTDPQVLYYNGVFYDELLMARPISPDPNSRA